MRLWGAVRAERLKLHRSLLVWVHVVSGLSAGGACGAYFAVSAWDPSFGADAFVQVLGATMPFMIGMVCGLAVDVEREAGGMSNLLAMPSRRRVFTAKVLLLLAWALVAVALAVGVFALALTLVGRNRLPLSAWILAIIGMVSGSLCWYLVSMLLALAAGRNASIGVGVLATLVSVGAMGGMAHGLVAHQLLGADANPILSWLPCIWPARFASLAIERGIALHPSADTAALEAIRSTFILNLRSCLVVTVLMAIVLLVWIDRFEDRQREEG